MYVCMFVCMSVCTCVMFVEYVRMYVLTMKVGGVGQSCKHKCDGDSV